MNIEIDGRTYYATQNYYNPDWWDEWLKKNLKKKVRLFSKTVKQPVNQRQTTLGFTKVLAIIYTILHLN